MSAFTRDLACPDCSRQYLVSGSSQNAASETEALAQFRCSCGQWMGAFVPSSASVERLIVTLKPENRLAAESPLARASPAPRSKKSSAA